MEYVFKHESKRLCNNCGIETTMNYVNDPSFPHSSASNGIHLLWTCPMCKSTDTDKTRQEKLAIEISNINWYSKDIETLIKIANILGCNTL